MVCPQFARSFATNDDAAEKAHDKAVQDPPAHPYRDNARVWQLYLEEAEKQAKERGASWRAGLDSLLIFVSRRISRAGLLN